MQVDSTAPTRASRRPSWHDCSAQSLVSCSHGWPKIEIVPGGIPELCDFVAYSRFHHTRLASRINDAATISASPDNFPSFVRGMRIDAEINIELEPRKLKDRKDKNIF